MFAVSLNSAAGTTPLLTTDPDGSLLHIDIFPNGTTSTMGFADASGAFRATAVIPEPGSFALLGVGLAEVL